MHVTAATFGQKVSLKEKQTPLSKVFIKISKQTGYDFWFNSDILKATTPVSIDIKNVELSEALKMIFRNQPLTYSIEDKVVTVKPKEEVQTSVITNIIDVIEVKGKVVDENGAPLGGASVVLKSNGKGIITAADGTFILKGIEDGAFLVVMYIGFNQKELKASRELGLIRLSVATNDLDAVQIQGYGTTSRRLSLANITSVKAKDIENQVISNPILALQGRVPGLRIQQSNGNIGASIDVNIQGLSSLKGSSTPFYVVDGVPYPGSTMPGTGNSQVWGNPTNISLQAESSGNPLTYLNPSDIESIEVLKDADATAIYGSRAANGAIIITTKKGKPGALTVDFTAQSGWDKVPQVTEFVNTTQYLELRREAFANANQAITPGIYDLDGTWDQNKYTDWQKELIRTQNYSNANLSVSGGTITSNYRVALTANRQGSPYGRDFRNDNIALSTSLNSASSNQKFKMALVANYLNGHNNLPSLGTALAGGGFIPILTPNAPSLYKADGSLNWELDQSGNATFTNPLAWYLTNPFEVKTNNLTSNLNLSYNILAGLNLSTSVGYNRNQQQEFSGSLLAAYPPSQQIDVQRSGSYRYTQSNSINVEPKISYRYQFGAHRINAILVATYIRRQGETSGIMGEGQNSDAQIKNLAAASSFSQTGAFYQEYRSNSILGRVEYSYRDKYLINLSASRDGSTRFGPENRFGNFGSIAAGWIVSEEKWLKDKAKWINFLKIRSSFGITGSDGIGDYSFMDLFTSAPVGVPYQGIVGLAGGGLFNAGLQWEEKKSLNVGLESSFLNDRVGFTMNYNRNRSSNLLEFLSLPVTSGTAGTVLVNFDAVVQNTGWELVLTGIPVKTKNFQWTLTGNLTIPKNKLISLSNSNRIGFGADYKIGEPLRAPVVRNYLGVNPLTGLEVLEDINGNPVDRDGNKSQIATSRIINALPYYGGIQTGFIFGSFSLNLSFDFFKGLQPRYFYEVSRPGSEAYNQPNFAYSADRWQFPGDIAVIQKYSTAHTSGVLIGTRQNYEDASYIRLNNAALSWSVPTGWATKLGLKRASVGLNAQNIYTFSRYSGPSPITGAAAIPPTRTIVMNLTASF